MNLINEFTKIILLLEGACLDEFSINLSTRDFSRLSLQLQNIQRNPIDEASQKIGFVVPQILLKNTLIKNQDYFNSVLEEASGIIQKCKKECEVKDEK